MFSFLNYYRWGSGSLKESILLEMKIEICQILQIDVAEVVGQGSLRGGLS